MRIFDFLRKKKKETISINDSDNLIKSERTELTELLNHELEKIKEKIKSFTIGLEENIKILEKIDLKEKKEYERIKFINLQNLNSYIEHLKRLDKDLQKNLSLNDYGELISNSIRAFNFFYKNSRNNLDRATILIGREIEVTEDLIKDIYKYLGKQIKLNSENLKKISRIKNFFQNKEELKKLKDSLEEKEKSCNILLERISNLKSEIQSKENKLYLLLNSDRYISWKNTRDLIKRDIDKLNKEIYQIKKELELKNLIKKYHGAKTKSELIRRYKDDFLSALYEDSQFLIREVITPSQAEKLKSIKERLEEIKTKEESYRLNKEEENLKEDLIELENSLNEYKAELKRLERQKEKIKEKISKLNERNKELIELILDVEIKLN